MIKKFEQFEEEFSTDGREGVDNYMFFANLKNICTMVTDILEMDQKEIDKMLTDDHDWAADHISKSKESISHVHSWLKSNQSVA